MDAAAVIGKGKAVLVRPCRFKADRNMADLLIFIFQAVAEDILDDPLELGPVDADRCCRHGILKSNFQTVTAVMDGLFVNIIL